VRIVEELGHLRLFAEGSEGLGDAARLFPKQLVETGNVAMSQSNRCPALLAVPFFRKHAGRFRETQFVIDWYRALALFLVVAWPSSKRTPEGKHRNSANREDTTSCRLSH
jgi:hypothetical protein